MKTFSGHNASQRADELFPFIVLLKREHINRYLEVGARHGDTFHEVMKSLAPGSLGVAIDLPGGRWGTSPSAAAPSRPADDLRRRGYKIHVILGDSTSDAVLGSVKALAPRYDACLIDGDHLVEGVTRDWQN